MGFITLFYFVFPYSWWVEGHGTPAAIDSNESIYEIVKMLKNMI